MNKREMLNLRFEGRPYQFIANKAGISRQRVQQILSPPKAIRDFVIGKFNGLCTECGIYVGKGGHVHHKNSNVDEDYNDIENLVLLCVGCHRRSHRDEEKIQGEVQGKVFRKLVKRILNTETESTRLAKEAKTRENAYGQKKSLRNENVHQYHLKHPKMTHEAIGHVFKVCRVRITQILNHPSVKESVNA